MPPVEASRLIINRDQGVASSVDGSEHTESVSEGSHQPFPVCAAIESKGEGVAYQSRLLRYLKLMSCTFLLIQVRWR